MSWSKGRLGKIKNSPAAKDLKRIATMAGDSLMPMENPGLNHPANAGRSNHTFNEGANEHVAIRNDDNARFDNFYSRGQGMGTNGNVTSITNGLAIRGRKAARRPEGY